MVEESWERNQGVKSGDCREKGALREIGVAIDDEGSMQSCRIWTIPLLYLRTSMSLEIRVIRW